MNRTQQVHAALIAAHEAGEIEVCSSWLAGETGYSTFVEELGECRSDDLDLVFIGASSPPYGDKVWSRRNVIWHTTDPLANQPTVGPASRMRRSMQLGYDNRRRKLEELQRITVNDA